ncbi:MAG TPA: PHP domain-containing protein [Candidatus Polarisedimenticolia bacterium]|nr:PHP domain-containing protein [Candidatus Polarisedimenticolia bacterium]
MIRRVDLHVHTRFSRWKRLKSCNACDSYSDPLEVYDRLRRAGMDFVAFTDHDSIDGALDLLSRRPDLEPRVIIGEEVETWFPETGQWVHVNVFGINEAIHRQVQALAGDVRELTAWLRQQDILHVLNHPFQSYRLQKPAPRFVEDILELFDHFESRNATLSARHNAAVEEMVAYAAALGVRKHLVGGSDAHELRRLAACHTEADVPAGAGPHEWLAAVARGEGRPMGESIGARALTADVYRIIGRYYLAFADRATRRRMTPVNYAAAAALAPVVAAGLPAFLNLGNCLRLEAVTLHVRRLLRTLPSTSSGARQPGELLEESPD